jgi:hypothetical protein
MNAGAEPLAGAGTDRENPENVNDGRRGQMPQIIVTADSAPEREQDGIMLRERVNIADFESERFAANLLERLGWAVLDATEVQQDPARREPVHA